MTEVDRRALLLVRSPRVRATRSASDLVSRDLSVVGDAKYLTLVHRQGVPPAKFMDIAGHVWLLERTLANRRFLGRYRTLVEEVRGLELTRFRGHPQTCGGGHDAEEPTAVFAGVQAADGRPGAWGGGRPIRYRGSSSQTAQSIWNWVRQAERDEGTRTDGLTTEEKEELRR